MIKEETPNEETEIEEVEVVTAELRNQVQARRIVNMLSEGRTYNQIAEEFGVHRDTLYAIINQEDMRPLIMAEVTGMESAMKEIIQELQAKPGTSGKKAALAEMGKMVRHTKDKLYPSLFRNENLNASIQSISAKWEENCLMFEQLVYSTLTRMPPPMRTLFWDKWMEVKQENGWEHVQAPYDALHDTHPRKQKNRRQA